MGQVLHGCATTTHAVRAAIQRSKAPIQKLAERYGLNRKTVRRWRGRDGVQDAAMGPKDPHSTVLTAEEEAIALAFRRHTLLPLDDCLYALRGEPLRTSVESIHGLRPRRNCLFPGLAALEEITLHSSPRNAVPARRARSALRDVPSLGDKPQHRPPPPA
jgi:transposase-like protein